MYNGCIEQENSINIFYCENCGFKCCKKSNWEKHIQTNKHKKKILMEKNSNAHICLCCNMSFPYLSSYTRHETTEKHKLNKTINDNKITIIEAKKYVCKKCGQEYSVYNSYWHHTKKCNMETERATTMTELLSTNELTANQSMNDVINILIKENKEMRTFMCEQMKTMIEMSKPSNTIMNTVNGTLNNNKFNINVFLNEKCKDAMNLSEFLETIVVTREDLENNARLGFVNGITKILLDNIRRQDISERSIHCTDFKRETMYIKDDDKWTKQDNSDKLNQAISKVSSKSIKTLMEWQEENPDFLDDDSEFYQNSNMILKGSIAGKERDTFYPKIIKNIARETTIDKNLITI